MDPATALRWAHNVISDDKLKALSFVPSHELVSHHVHKLVHVTFFKIVSSCTYVFFCTYIYLLSSGP